MEWSKRVRAVLVAANRPSSTQMLISQIEQGRYLECEGCEMQSKHAGQDSRNPNKQENLVVSRIPKCARVSIITEGSWGLGARNMKYEDGPEVSRANQAPYELQYLMLFPIWVGTRWQSKRSEGRKVLTRVHGRGQIKGHSGTRPAFVRCW